MTNHPNRNRKVFGLIKVAARTERDSAVHLHFTSRDAFDDTLFALRKDGFAVEDSFWGYSLFQTATEAMETVRAFVK